MKYLYLYLIGMLLFTHSCSPVKKDSETTSYYFIRHAEKDRTNSSNSNPHLTEVGEIRAEHWNTVFKSIEFDAVYSSDYHRTRETALPTATKNNLEIILYDPTDIDLQKFLIETKGKTVLVVGHSNTIPKFVNDIIGEKKYVDIADNNNGNLYIVTQIKGEFYDQVLLIN